MRSKRNGFARAATQRRCGLCNRPMRTYCRPCADEDRKEIARLRAEIASTRS